MELGLKLVYSLKIMVIGLAIVFLGLVILICCINIMAWIMGRAESSKQKKAEAAKPAPAPAPVVPQEALEEVPAEDEAELVAVITAAITMFAGEGKKLKVRQIRKANRSENAWARAGRLEALDNRF